MAADLNWLSLAEQYLSQFPSPPIFQKWAAIATLGAAIQRRRWMISRGRHIYPNLYVFLVAPPATGKGEAISPMLDVMRQVEDQHITTDSLTAAALVDEINDAAVGVMFKGGHLMECNPVNLYLEEFGNFMPNYDTQMMNLLTKLWDNRGYYERRRGNKAPVDLPNAHVSFLGGTTPGYFANNVPEGVWEEGFMSRCLIVWGEGTGPKPLIEDDLAIDTSGFKTLVKELKKRLSRYGRIRWDADAIAEFNKWWVDNRGAPTPKHPKLLNYLGRRHIMVMKLCIIHAVARDAETIAVEDFAYGQESLLELEANLDYLFNAMRSGGAEQVAKETFHFVQSLAQSKPDVPIPHWKVTQFLMTRLPPHQIPLFIERMVEARMLKQVELNKVGKCYFPGGMH